MALRNAQGQRGKYLTLALSSTRNTVEDICASVSKFQSAKIGDNRTRTRGSRTIRVIFPMEGNFASYDQKLWMRAEAAYPG
jgi:hypothetical protein